MKKSNLFAILFAIVSVLFFAGCDNDNDKKDGDTNPPVEDCFCDEAKTVACPDGGKDACEKPAVCDPACIDDKECKCEAGKCECVDKAEPACTCDPTCDAEKQDCTKGDDGKCGCVDKVPAEEKKCDPVCDAEKQDCVCEADKCECKDKAPAPVAQCDPACKDAEECVVGDDGKAACKAKEEKPVEECKCEDNSACPDNDKTKCAKPADDPCKDKAENADCGENKTCQKGEGDKLECKDKPADSTPAEPTQPSKPE
jgi:hypothetical protein